MLISVANLVVLMTVIRDVNGLTVEYNCDSVFRMKASAAWTRTVALWPPVPAVRLWTVVNVQFTVPC